MNDALEKARRAAREAFRLPHHSLTTHSSTTHPARPAAMARACWRQRVRRRLSAKRRSMKFTIDGVWEPCNLHGVRGEDAGYFLPR